MKYIFFGTPEFAAIILEKLISANLIPLAIVTNPDRPIGRKKEIKAPPLKSKVLSISWRKEDKIDILQPEKLDAGFAQTLESYGADFFVVAAYGKILPDWLIKMPPLGAVGVHPSLLPKYRGASPIQTSILNGDKITGVTIFILNNKVDNGPILAKKEVEINDGDNYESLIKKIAEISGKLLVETLPLYFNKKIAPHLQNEDEATYTKKISTRDAFVDLNKDSPMEIWLKIRALNPEPGVWTTKKTKDGEKRIKLLEADLASGKLILKKIQIEGKKPSLL